MTIKCVGCWDLLREELNLLGGVGSPRGTKHLVVYNCPCYFPYACALSGLFRPTSQIVEAVKDCTEKLDLNCIIRGCLDLNLTTFGKDKIVFICKEHEHAWWKWLDDHPGRDRSYFAPRGRGIQARWVEVFREFIEDMRSGKGALC